MSVVLLLAGCSTTPEGPRTAQTPPDDVQTPAAAAAPVVFELSSAGLPEQGMWKCDPVFADVNADGHLDLAAIPRLGDGPQVWLGDGRGNWRDSSFGLDPGSDSCGGGLALGDLNEDGHLDLAVADHCAGVFVYLGDGAGSWRMVTASLNPGGDVTGNPSLDKHVGAEDLDLGDLDADGHLDLLVGGSDEGGLNVYYGNGSGQGWTRAECSLPIGGWANRVRLTDLDGDGWLDAIATFSSGPRVWLNDQNGDWRAAFEGLPSPMMQGLYHGLDVADMNGDGRDDLIVANWVDGPEVYLQQPGVAWRKMPDVFPDMLGGAIGLTTGHVDDDGHRDIVVSGRLDAEAAGMVRGIFALLGDGRGSFRRVERCGLPDTGLSGVAGVAMGDVDNDGWNDVVLASGMHVETGPGPREPVISYRMLVWRSSPMAQASGSLADVTDGEVEGASR
jgi:hypothetical protein